VMGQDSGRLMLAGCPSVQIARIDAGVPKTHDLALNVSFVHEVCRNYVAGLLELVKAVASRYRRVLWICHSRMDADQATGVNRELGLGFDVVRPRNALEAGSSYAACERALVTRFHAGMFCLANTIPFSFVGYDVKCWHLMSMIADEPHRYILPIDRMSNADAPAELIRMQAHLENNDEPLRRAHELLRTWFGEQTNRFVDAAISKLSPSQSRDRAEAASQERF
jgi:polysaccharide pyruvyl transferase WcaK-like protein